MRRARNLFAVLGVAAVLAGCEGSLGGIQPQLVANLRFERWVRITADSCWGSVVDLEEGRFGPAENVEMRFWYATAQGETARVLRDGHGFPVPVQITNGERRYPRVGQITWNGGFALEHPRAPSLDFGGSSPSWTATGPDSMSVAVHNAGGYAYHLTMTVENRNGIQQLAAAADPLPAGESVVFVSAPLFFTTSPVAPRIRVLRWEDYGGIRDSLIPTP